MQQELANRLPALADALSKHPNAFSDLYVNMVAAGEAGGILGTILLRLAVFLEKNDAIVRKVKGAMIYPAVIFSVAVIAVENLWAVPFIEAVRASGGELVDQFRVPSDVVEMVREGAHSA